MCGVISTSLQKPLCNGCIKHYREQHILVVPVYDLQLKNSFSENAKDVPTPILTKPGIVEILFGSGKTAAHCVEPSISDGSSSALVTSILHLASSYHSQASEPRLNNSVRTVGGVAQPQGLNKFKNLGKANQAVELRKAKQEEAKLLDNGIRISAVLWMAEGSSNRLTEVHVLLLNPEGVCVNFFVR